VEIGASDASLGTEGACANKVVPQLEDRAGGDISATGSLDAMGMGVVHLGLLGYPGAPPTPASWRRVEDVVELACSQVATAHQLLFRAIAVVARDILHLVWFSPEERKALAEFLQSLLGLLMPPFFYFSRSGYLGTLLMPRNFRKR
jgi:hypothetical protein